MRSGLLFVVMLGIVAATDAAERVDEPPLTDKDRAHWSFKPPVRPKTPTVSDPTWVRNPIDNFILHRLDQAKLKPAPAVDRPTLLRRVTFDLTGLPPTAKELGDFLNDHRPDAYARVVDRLLASPHYGERWAQHWLDVVRFAESNGYEGDVDRPHAWRYRDYVVRSFNEDKAYSRFLTEQLAGDLLAKALNADSDGTPTKEQSDLLIAAGFNRCGPIHLVGGNVDPAEPRQELLNEMTTTVGSAFLGLTIHCARCHDHKFDPVSQADYYRLQAFFAGAQMHETDLAGAAERAERERQIKLLDEKALPLKRQLTRLEEPYKQRLTQEKIAKLEAPYREALATDAKKRTKEQTKLFNNAQTLTKVTWDEVVAALSPDDRATRVTWRRELYELEAKKPQPLPQAWTIEDNGAKPALPLLLNGDLKKKGPLLHSDYPRVLVQAAPPLGEPDAEGFSRLDLAKWLTRGDHPLTARVIVNRLWQHHFGRGLVATPNDFGRRGEKPTHPELLDWLACELVEKGWSLKHIHRLMVLSNTYQQDSRMSPEAKKADPDNRLLSGMSRRRLSAEGIRDNVLAVTGMLNPQIGGPRIRVPLEPEVYNLIFTENEPEGLWPVTPDVSQHYRRSLYLYAKRNLRMPLLEAFDQPDTLFSCPVRPVSTFAPQALILLNGPFMQEQSKAFAARLLHDGGKDRAAQIDLAYRLALARTPREVERKMALEFLEGQTDLVRDRLLARLPVGLPQETPPDVDPAYAAALVDFCLALLNRNEFVYVK